MVSPSASNPDLAGINPYFFRICPSDVQHGPQLARFAWQTLAARRAGIIYVNNDYGRGVRRAFDGEFARLGGAVVEADPDVPETRSLEPYLSRMRQRGAVDVLVLAAERAGAVLALREMQALKLSWRVIGGDALTGIEADGALAEGVHVSWAYLPDRPEDCNVTFVAGYAGADPGHRPAGDPGLPGEGRSREAAVRGSDGDRRLRHQRGCPRQAGRDRRDPRWPARFRERALMRRMFDTIRSRIVAGLIPLAIGLVGTALLAAVTLRQMRYAVADELAGLRASSEIGSGLVAMVFEEIRGAEQYLAAPSADARQLFQTASDETFHYERRLEALGITGEDRIAVSRLKQLNAAIQVDYAIAHALKDLGRDGEALAQSAAVRPQAAEVTRLVRDLASRQAVKAAQVADRLAAASREREK